MENTFTYQDTVKPLPVPDLADTAEIFLSCIKPVADDESFEKTSAILRRFVEGDGAALHKRLLLYANEKSPNSWMMPYSRDIYLNMRGPITVDGNFLVGLTPFDFADNYDYLGLLAVLAYGIGCVFRELAEETLPPMSGRDGYLCMKQFGGAFRGARVPREGKDIFRIHEYRDVDSFGVFHKNRFYSVKLIDFDGGSYHVAEPSELRKAFEEIWYCDEPAPDLNFNIAGFAGSDKAAKIISKITEGKPELFDAVHKTMFNITMTEAASGDVNAREMLYAPKMDIWPLKTWSITVYSDKKASINVEHTYMDGLTHMYLIDRVIKNMAAVDCSSVMAAGGVKSGERVLPVSFDLSAARDELIKVREDYLELINGFDGGVFTCDIPIDLLKANKISIDFYLQLAFQFAAFEAYGEARFIHESVSAAQYYEGRTSAVRTISAESERFLKALKGGSSSMELLKAASIEHSARIKAAKEFRCFIRHSAALMNMWAAFGDALGISECPEIFSSPIYLRYCSQEISTSTFGNALSLDKFAFAHQTDGGLGIGYITHNGHFIADILFQEKHRELYEKFVCGLDSYFNLMDELIRSSFYNPTTKVY